MRIEKLSSIHGIKGNVEVDSGFSFTYQVQVYFMSFYQRTIIESTFAQYNSLA